MDRVGNNNGKSYKLLDGLNHAIAALDVVAAASQTCTESSLEFQATLFPASAGTSVETHLFPQAIVLASPPNTVTLTVGAVP
jgi:hypothetical protein